MPPHPVRVYDGEGNFFTDLSCWESWTQFCQHERFTEAKVGKFHVALRLNPQGLPVVEYSALELP